MTNEGIILKALRESREIFEMALLSSKITGIKARLWICNQSDDGKKGKHSDYRVRAQINKRNLYFPFDPNTISLYPNMSTDDFKGGEISRLRREVQEFLQLNKSLIKVYIDQEKNVEGELKVDIHKLKASLTPIR